MLNSAHNVHSAHDVHRTCAHYMCTARTPRSVSRLRGAGQGAPPLRDFRENALLDAALCMYNHIKSNPCKFPNLFFEVSIWKGNNIINDFNGYCRCSNRQSWHLPRNIEQGGWANTVTTSQGAATGPWDPPWERAVSKGAPGNRTLGLHVHCLCTVCAL